MDGSRAPAQTTPSARLEIGQLLGALSHALDITEGQPEGHCVRCCWIGLSIGRAVALEPSALRDLYYTLLLKDLGCSSNAARICELYLTDDLNFKRDFKTVGAGLTEVVQFVLEHTGVRAGMAQRFRHILNIFQNGGSIAHELIETRCQRGAQIARQMRFSEAVATGIQSLDEHWDGKGKPERLAGEAIPLYARIALLAQVIDVFATSAGRDAACDEVRRRSGTWFDPRLTSHFEDIARDDGFWVALHAKDLGEVVLRLEPAKDSRPLDDDYLDDVAAAFGQIVDAKSPYTSGHSTRVALYTDLLAERLGLTVERRRWLKRAALLHDLGKLGVSNSILDKPDKLTETEWAVMRHHAALSEAILARIDAFHELARIAGAHHERLDGNGYPRGLVAAQISLETRIITTADIFDALSADRPYRKALPLPKTLEIMSEQLGTAIDPKCLGALRDALRELNLASDPAP